MTELEDIARKAELLEQRKNTNDSKVLKEIRKDLLSIYCRQKWRDRTLNDPKIKKVKCKTCGDTFTRKVRNGTGALYCPACRKKRNDKKRESSRYAKHTCEYCGNEELAEEMTEHEGDKLCSVCWNRIVNERGNKHKCGYCKNKELDSQMTMHKGLRMCSVCWDNRREEQDAGKDDVMVWLAENDVRASALSQIQDFGRPSKSEHAFMRNKRIRDAKAN